MTPITYPEIPCESAGNGIEVTEILTDRDRQSYATGLKVAQAIRAECKPIDRHLFLAGIKDGLEGRASLIEDVDASLCPALKKMLP